MTIKEMRKALGDTQKEFAKRYNIPFRTIQNWENGVNMPPDYVMSFIEQQVEFDLMNRRTIMLPDYDAKKSDLPRRSNFVGGLSWLKAVKECLGDNTVFALDQALMCQQYFLGRNEEYLIWVYGNDSLSRYNGVVVLGNHISQSNIIEKNGLIYTNFNRTLADSFANESILDMQGITEALSKYYYKNGESFNGIFVSPEYQNRFDLLAEEAINYYTY